MHVPRRSAFSLIEMVLVVVILGVISFIAIPRMVGASSNATAGNMQANLILLDRAITLYAGEHDGRSPAHEPDGSVNTDETTFARRLILKTDSDGGGAGTRIFGPYLLDLPANANNGLRLVRIDGARAGANTHGWRFDSATRVIEPDDGASSGASVFGAATAVGASSIAPAAPD